MDTAPSTTDDYAGVSSVIERFGRSYIEAHGAQMPFVQLNALAAMERCRTAASGGVVLLCRECGVFEHHYHSCGHRACPKCCNQDNDVWLTARATEVLPIDYFHIVVTVPEQLRESIRAQPAALYGVLMKAAAKSIKGLMLEQHGLKVGMMAVLHTWNRQLGYHPHVHCVVTAGGVDATGVWKTFDHDETGLRRLLAVRFRDTFLAMAHDAVQSPHHLQISGPVDTIEWYVYVDRARGNTQQILGYLARYVHRTALSDRRIVSVDGDRVTYLYRPSGSKQWKPMTVSGHEFLRRFLQHVPPKGFHRVRYYGLWSSACRKKLHAIRDVLFAADPDATAPVVELKGNADAWLACPHCGAATRDIVGQLARVHSQNSLTHQRPAAQPPPLKTAA